MESHLYNKKVINRYNFFNIQGWKKVPSSSLGQVDFCVGQVTFPTHLPYGQGDGKAARELS